jgi:hypothetical protein
MNYPVLCINMSLGEKGFTVAVVVQVAPFETKPKQQR